MEGRIPLLAHTIQELEPRLLDSLLEKAEALEASAHQVSFGNIVHHP